jgi:hypothetical protein
VGWLRYRRDVGAALAVTGACLAVGLLAGAIWAVAAPRPSVVAVEDGAALDPLTTEAFFGGDGWFVVVVAASGMLVGIGTWTRTRDDGVGALLGLAMGGLLGAVVAWRVGVWLAGDPIVAPPPPGERVDAPLRLGARGAIFAWPVVAVTAYFVLTAGFARVEAAARGDAPAAAAGDASTAGDRTDRPD